MKRMISLYVVLISWLCCGCVGYSWLQHWRTLSTTSSQFKPLYPSVTTSSIGNTNVKLRSSVQQSIPVTSIPMPDLPAKASPHHMSELLVEYIKENRLPLADTTHYQTLYDNVLKSIQQRGTRSANAILTETFRKLPLGQMKEFATILATYFANKPPEGKTLEPRLYEITTIFSLLSNAKLAEETILLNEAIRQGQKNFIPDVTFMKIILKSAVFCRSWDYVIQLLTDSLSFGEGVNELATSCITSLRKIPTSYFPNPKQRMLQMEKVLHFIQTNKIEPSEIILESMLALCCEHGKQEDISNILRLMKFYGKPLATSTFNILLNQCVQEDNTMKAGGILKKMANENILPDTITYHTLLKLYVRQNDQVAVDKILIEMQQRGIKVTTVTKSILLPLENASKVNIAGRKGKEASPLNSLIDLVDSSASNNDFSTIQLQSSEINSARKLFSIAISSATSAFEAKEKFFQAKNLNLMDEFTYLTMLQALQRFNDYEFSFEIVDTMMKEGLSLSNPLLSFVVNICFRDPYTALEDKLQRLQKYLQYVQTTSPQAFTAFIAQRIVKEVVASGEALLAVDIYLKYFSTNTLSSSVSYELLQSLKNVLISSSTTTKSAEVEPKSYFSLQPDIVSKQLSVSISNGDQLSRRAIESKAWNFFRTLYDANLKFIEESIDTMSTSKIYFTIDPNKTLWRQRQGFLESKHFGIIFQIVCYQNSIHDDDNGGPESSLERIDQLYKMMTGSYGTSDLSRQQDACVWKPSIYIIAELIRYARRRYTLTQSSKIEADFITKVMEWALDYSVPIPFAVISDALSLLYRSGDIEKVLELYKSFYYNQLILHWSEKDVAKLEMDLHGYNRAMAYAALLTAFDEIRGMGALKTKILTIITGRNESPKSLANKQEEFDHDSHENEESSSNEDDSSEINQAFRLNEEIQQVLIEDFYPPISSSTLPGNIGRLAIAIRDIYEAT